MSASSNLPSRRRPKPDSKSSNFSLYLLGAVLLLLIIGVIAINIWNSRTPTITTQPLDVEAGWVDRNSMGNPEAKVVIDVYEDFLCPHCADFNKTVKPQLYEEYIKTGKVRYVYHTFPLGGFEPGASIAANAALCAADQNQFWQMHDQLFAMQSQGMSAYQPDSLTKVAEAMGLNRSEFSACMNGYKYRNEILNTVSQGAALGVGGTPTVFANGTLVTNGADYTVLKAEVDKLLASGG